MKIIFLLIFSLALASAQQTNITGRAVNGDSTAVELDLGDAVLRGGGAQTAPSLSMRKGGQGLFMAALPMGGTLSLYRQVGSEKREWLRINYAGIQVADAAGNLQQAFTGRIRPGCSAVVTEGLITGEDCGTAASVVGWAGPRPLPEIQTRYYGRPISPTRMH